MKLKKIAIFFGAGAEMSYGLPSGGKFALDIFRMDSKADKDKFREQREKINRRSVYAKNWLPEDYQSKPISSFGKTQYETLVRSSLENKRHKILKYLNNFDKNVEKINDFAKANIDIKEHIQNITNTPFGSVVFTHEVKLSPMLGENNNEIFSSNYFSTFLKILELPDVDLKFKRKVQTIVRALLELLIGSCGEDLIHRLNDGIFEKKPDTIEIFDDLGGIFSLDYRSAGLTGLDYIINAEAEKLDLTDQENSSTDLVVELGRLILEDIFAQALDYQSLIDDNWRYLYNPKTDWAKFCKIVIFLHTVRRYIMCVFEQYEDKCITGPGYYHDIKGLNNFFDVVAIGTTNYNKFIETIINKEVYFLNGSVSDYYDPYLNKIVEEDNDSDHITVPFLFTQSGVKPLTSVRMSERYVELYNKFRGSDIICIIGYGFNSDDGHINGMFRSLIDEDNKEIYILHFSPDLNENINILKNDYQEKLRLESQKGLNIILVDGNRKSYDDIMWYNYLVDILN